MPPVEGWAVTQEFGEDIASYPEYSGHPGRDYGCPIGTPVVAALAGDVLLAGTDPAYPGRGTHVVLEHAGGVRTYYLHLSALHVAAGQAVAQGEEIGLSGNTGLSTGPHLHFGVRPDSNLGDAHQGFVDPRTVLD